jgi:pimeloyl-ACP methyl ester carboxylesterase
VFGLSVCVLLGAATVSCGPKGIQYRLPQIAALPIGATTVMDARDSFADVFCGVLRHTPDRWDACERYLHLAKSPTPAMVDPEDRFLAGYRVLMIGGIFSRCLDVTVFQDAAAHLSDKHAFTAEHLPVFGNGSSEQNAVLIKDYILRDTSTLPFILVGHSKGAVDLMEALVHHPEIRTRVKGLLTVASPVAGSRLVDGVPAELKALSDRFPEIGGCPLGDGRGYISLERSTRQRFFAAHLSSLNQLRSYSISAVASRADTSRILHGLWDYLAYYSLDQDTHVTADEAVMPGSRFLAQANGDHWAVASPVELTANEWLRERADRNHYPRAALLEAALRVIVNDLNANP